MSKTTNKPDYRKLAAEARNVDNAAYIHYSFLAAQEANAIEHATVIISEDLIGYYKDESNSIDHPEMERIFNPDARPPI